MKWKYAGLARGMIIMIIFGLLWLLIPFQDNDINYMLLILLTIFMVLLIIGCINVLSFAAKMPAESEENTILYKSQSRKIGKVFGIVFSVEFGLIGLAAVILFSSGLNDLFSPIVAIIVGLHFYPLSRLLKADIYNVTGTIAVFAGIVSLLINTDPARRDFVGFGMGIILWLTAAYIFIKAKKEMTKFKSNA